MLDSSIMLIASYRPIIEVAGIMKRRMPELTTYRYFYPRRTAFDNMVNAENIALIRSEELRENLSEYYFDEALTGTTQERAKEMTRTFVDYFTPLILNKEMLLEFYEGDLLLPGPGEIDFRRNPELISIMFSLRMATSGQSMEFEIRNDLNVELRNMIASYLKKIRDNSGSAGYFSNLQILIFAFGMDSSTCSSKLCHQQSNRRVFYSMVNFLNFGFISIQSIADSILESGSFKS